jgi:hypothetical protein
MFNKESDSLEDLLSNKKIIESLKRLVYTPEEIGGDYVLLAELAPIKKKSEIVYSEIVNKSFTDGQHFYSCDYTFCTYKGPNVPARKKRSMWKRV